MRILQKEKSPSKVDIQIEKGCAKLGIVIDGPVNKESLDDIKLSVDLVGNAGNVNLIPKTSLRNLFCMSAVAEGFFVVMEANARGYVDLSKIGSLALNTGEYLSVSYEGLLEGQSISMFAMDVPYTTRSAFKLEKVAITRASKELNVGSKTDLYLPVTKGVLDYVQIQYAERLCQFTQDEIMLLNEAMNDIVSVETSQTVYGYDKLLHLDISEAINITIVPVDGQSFDIYLGSEVIF